MNDIMNEILNDTEGKMEYLPTENELATIFNVSRITIRAAIKGLEERGFVTPQQGKGVKVTNRSVEVATNSLAAMILRRNATQNDLLEVRKIIEIQSVRLAALRATVEDIKAMKYAVDKMIDKNTPDDEYNNSDLQFHILIAKASKNPLLEVIMTAIQPLILDAIKITQNHYLRPEQSTNYHANIYKSIEMRDPELAVKSMIEHLEATERMIDSYDLNTDQLVKE